jgi:hypothetical protein
MRRLAPLVLLLALACVGNWSANAKYRDTQVYFAGLEAHKLPLVPEYPVSEAEARSLKAYLVASYDDEGRITTVRKFFRGELFFVHEYEYDEDGNLSVAKITDGGGAVSVLKRNAEGKLVRQ